MTFESENSETSLDSEDSEISFYSEDSINYIAEIETEENDESCSSTLSTSSDDDQEELYADDPLADAEWTAKYQKEVDAEKELERALTDRLYKKQRGSH